MRTRVYLTEYDRAIEARKLAPKLLTALQQDKSVRFSADTALDDRLFNTPGSTWSDEHGWQESPPEERIDAAQLVLQAIEERDPTPNKMYMQWLGRMYARGDVKMEDLNRQGLLTTYHRLKLKKKIKPEHADINRFKSYSEFEDVAMTYDVPVEQERGTSEKLYSDTMVSVVLLKDEAAACHYGRGTKWCTAGRENNMFDRYNRWYELVAFLPKTPKYPAEKYQVAVPRPEFIHNQTNYLPLATIKVQCMDERDDHVTFATLARRFPAAYEAVVRHPRLVHFFNYAPSLWPADYREQQFTEFVSEWRPILKKRHESLIAKLKVLHPDLVSLAQGMWNVVDRAFTVRVRLSEPDDVDEDAAHDDVVLAQVPFAAEMKEHLTKAVNEYFYGQRMMQKDLSQKVTDQMTRFLFKPLRTALDPFDFD